MAGIENTYGTFFSGFSVKNHNHKILHIMACIGFKDNRNFLFSTNFTFSQLFTMSFEKNPEIIQIRLKEMSFHGVAKRIVFIYSHPLLTC